MVSAAFRGQKDATEVEPPSSRSRRAIEAAERTRPTGRLVASAIEAAERTRPTTRAGARALSWMAVNSLKSTCETTSVFDDVCGVDDVISKTRSTGTPLGRRARPSPDVSMSDIMASTSSSSGVEPVTWRRRNLSSYLRARRLRRPPARANRGGAADALPRRRNDVRRRGNQPKRASRRAEMGSRRGAAPRAA